MPSGVYYVTATEPGKRESGRLALTVFNRVNMDASGAAATVTLQDAAIDLSGSTETGVCAFDIGEGAAVVEHAETVTADALKRAVEEAGYEAA